jgi:hypothetical protein
LLFANLTQQEAPVMQTWYDKPLGDEALALAQLLAYDPPRYPSRRAKPALAIQKGHETVKGGGDNFNISA